MVVYQLSTLRHLVYQTNISPLNLAVPLFIRSRHDDGITPTACSSRLSFSVSVPVPVSFPLFISFPTNNNHRQRDARRMRRTLATQRRRPDTIAPLSLPFPFPFPRRRRRWMHKMLRRRRSISIYRRGRSHTGSRTTAPASAAAARRRSPRPSRTRRRGCRARSATTRVGRWGQLLLFMSTDTRRYLAGVKRRDGRCPALASILGGTRVMLLLLLGPSRRGKSPGKLGPLQSQPRRRRLRRRNRGESIWLRDAVFVYGGVLVHVLPPC